MLYTWICCWNGYCGWLSCIGFNICWNGTCEELCISWYQLHGYIFSTTDDPDVCTFEDSKLSHSSSLDHNQNFPADELLVGYIWSQKSVFLPSLKSTILKKRLCEIAFVNLVCHNLCGVKIYTCKWNVHSTVHTY